MSLSAPPSARAREIFLGAVETTVVEEREAYLEQACKGDDGLRTAVQTMLAAFDKLEGFLEKPAAATKPVMRGEKPPSEHIGPYKLLQEIGEGGCGVVYMAEQEQPVRRRVALKVIKLGMDTKSVIARFESERQARAMMDHPNIAKVLEAGATENGRPYFVMELVRGVRITDYCDQHKLSTEDRLRLFIQVAQAIQHAHQKGIIHRDIKPSNILVTLHDGVPVPKIIDFGIAKAVDQRLTDKTLFTEFQSFVGTPAYMSPEQAEMSGLDIDTRSDIYALGVLLYELLVGSTPFDPNTLRDAGLDECRRTIREVEPASPSQRLSTLLDADRETIAGYRHTESMTLLQRMRGDLDWIVMKCLEKDRQRRYASSNELALDVQAYLDGELVSARPPSAVYRLQKAWRRNRLALSAAAAVVAALVLGIGASLWQAVRATNAEQESTRSRKEAEINLEKAVQSAEDARLNAERARLNEYVADMNVANHSLNDGNLGRAWQLIQKHVPDEGQSDGRGFEWRYLAKQSKGDTHLAYPLMDESINDLSFSSDGALLAVGMDNGITVWGVSEQSLLTTLPKGAHSISFIPNTNLLVSVDGEAMRVWHSNTWSEKFSVPTQSRRIAVTSGGRFLATSAGRSFGRRGPREGVRLWDTATWQEPRQLTESSGPIVFTPDGTELILGRSRGIQVLDVQTGELVRTLEHSGRLFDGFGARSPWIKISPDGKTIAAAGADRSTVRLWDLPSGRAIGLLPSDARHRHHTSTIATAAWTLDSNTLITGSWDHSIQSWEVLSQEHLGGLRGYRNEVWAMAIDPSGETIASGGKDGQLLLWPLQESKKQDEITGSWQPLSFTEDASSLAALNRENQLAFFSSADLSPRRTIDLGEKSRSHHQPPVALS
ncbi:MAG: protein kinase [Verrucomicrobiaceae bacterium]|nr:protein kinase [Verrucomicrobiaceae bacterium]